MAYTKYSLTPADNNAAPPNGAPEGMLPSAVNDTMRDMMSQIRDVGDGIRGGTYTMTAPVITGGSITGVALSGNTLTNPVITGGSINNTTVGATTRSTGAFTTLASNGATTFTAGTASTSTTTGTAVITGGLGVSGRINAANFDGIVGANTAAAGNFTTLGATGVVTFSAGTVSAPAITTTGDTNTGIFFPAADTIAFTEGGVESMRINSSGFVGIDNTSPSTLLQVGSTARTADSTVYTANANGAYKTGLIYEMSGSNAGFVGYNKTGSAYLGIPDSTSGFSTSSSIPIVLATAGTERMRITSSGSVGIGTSSPSQVLDIVTSTGNSYIRNSNGTIETLTGVSSGLSAGATGSVSNHPYVFFTNNTERMRIDSSGNLGLGVTPSAWSGTGIKAFDISTAGAIYGSGAAVGIISNAYYNGTNYIYKTSFAATQYQQLVGTGAHAWFTAPSGTAGNAITFTQAMTLDASGNLLVGITSARANAGDVQVSKGISFPATQSAQSDANTLDDYEEGTWTPTIAGSTTAGTATYASVIGKYTKIGNCVFFEAYINYNSGTGTGNLLVSGLPFTSSSTGLYIPSIFTSAIALTASNIAQARIGTSASSVAIFQYPVGGGNTTEVPYDVAGVIGLSGYYNI